MGACWVQVDSEGNLCLAEGRCKVEAWPSLTKPELVTIWLALLTVPSNSKVVIRTDSLGAIAGLSRNLELREVKKWSKEKYFDWLIKIKDIVKIKGIELQLEKIKSYSKDRWNDKADALAKKGTEGR